MSLMESLLKTLRYNFINEALDFVGVHQERILQVRVSLLSDQSCISTAFNIVVVFHSALLTSLLLLSFPPPSA